MVEFEELKDAHDALAERLRRLEVSTSARVTAGTGADAGSGAGAEAGNRELGSVPAAGFAGINNGGLDALYKYILARVAKEEPKTLRAMIERPELEVAVKRQTIEANGSTLRGALAILISEKYFDGVREFGDVRKDLIRRGFLGGKAPNLQISQALQGLVELGFLTKEDTGYQAVPGMKIRIRESAA